MTSKATTVDAYLADLPEERREIIEGVRRVIRENLPDGVKEGMQYGMIGYYVPHSIYPDGYHCDPRQPLPFVALAAQKNAYSLYLFCLYTNPKVIDGFIRAFKATGKRLDMGKSCIRFKKLDDLPLDLVAATIAKMSLEGFIAGYEKHIPAKARKRSSNASPAKSAAKGGPSRGRSNVGRTRARTARA